MRPDTYWQALSVIGKLHPADAEIDRAADWIEQLDPHRLYAEILRSRVYTLCLRNLSRLDGGGQIAVLRERLENLEETEAARREYALPEVRTLLRLTRDLGARPIKGLVLREHYAQPELRHIGDLDLHVPDWDHAVRVTGLLRERGWRWDTHEFPWLKWTDGGFLYGQLSMVQPDNEDPQNRVDLHIGPFSVGHSALMPLAGWKSQPVLGVPAEVPGLESQLALIAAHAVNDGLLSMKDINDVHVMLSAGQGLDWGSVEELCRSAGAGAAMREILAAEAQIYGGEHAPQTSLARYPAGRPPGSAGSPAPYLSTTQEAADVRADRVRRLTLQDEQARGHDPGTAMRLANEAYEYFTADLSPRLGTPDPAGPLGPYRRRDLCWRLLPEEIWRELAGQAPRPGVPGSVSEEELAAQARLLWSAEGAVIQVGAEVFVPTLRGLVAPGSVALARSLADA